MFAHQAKTSPTLKDNDFTESGEKIIIGEEAKGSLMRTVECDVQVCGGVWDGGVGVVWGSVECGVGVVGGSVGCGV